LKVLYGEEGQAIERRHVYIAPPGHSLAVAVPDILRLYPTPKVRFSQSAADALLRSAAEVYGARTIAVVLTGSDGAGTEGLREIRAAGGICVVQDPDEAIDLNIQPNALIEDRLDFKVHIAEMGSLLTRLTSGLAA
jgi:two-component system, chemotaxis family, protein-glutamate methylesterase/glutaminase